MEALDLEKIKIEDKEIIYPLSLDLDLSAIDELEEYGWKVTEENISKIFENWDEAVEDIKKLNRVFLQNRAKEIEDSIKYFLVDSNFKMLDIEQIRVSPTSSSNKGQRIFKVVIPIPPNEIITKVIDEHWPYSYDLLADSIIFRIYPYEAEHLINCLVLLDRAQEEEKLREIKEEIKSSLPADSEKKEKNIFR